MRRAVVGVGTRDAICNVNARNVGGAGAVMTNDARPDNEQPAYPGSTRSGCGKTSAPNEPVGTQEENLPGRRVP